MFGEKIIANKMDFEANKDLLETQEQISPVMAHNKGYKFEMLYTRPSHPVLFAIDPENGNIYVVDVASSKKEQSPDDENKPSQEEEMDYPESPKGTPPQIQIERAKQAQANEAEKEDAMTLVYDSDDNTNIGD